MRAILPTAYFGSIDYYQKMVDEKAVNWEIYEHYVKQTVRNRMTIIGPNGIQALSIPVSKVNGNKTQTKEIQISRAENWEKNHWKAIETAYGASPYFEHYAQEVHDLIYQKTNSLIEFNFNIHARILKWLELPVETGFTTEYTVEIDRDYRVAFEERNTQRSDSYVQVFMENGNFVPDLSILDAIFNLGPMARKLLID